MDQAKLERFLQLMLLEVFEARCRALSLKATLSPELREAYDDAFKGFLKDHADEALWRWFKNLRGENDEAADVANPADDLWKSFQEAEKKSERSTRFEEEWKKLWDAL